MFVIYYLFVSEEVLGYQDHDFWLEWAVVTAGQLGMDTLDWIHVPHHGAEMFFHGSKEGKPWGGHWDNWGRRKPQLGPPQGHEFDQWQGWDVEVYRAFRLSGDWESAS